jgi:hypothetical protein
VETVAPTPGADTETVHMRVPTSTA